MQSFLDCTVCNVTKMDIYENAMSYSVICHAGLIHLQIRDIKYTAQLSTCYKYLQLMNYIGVPETLHLVWFGVRDCCLAALLFTL